MPVSKPTARIELYERCLDRAVEEVFLLMTGTHCFLVRDCPVEERETYFGGHRVSLAQ